MTTVSVSDLLGPQLFPLLAATEPTIIEISSIDVTIKPRPIERIAAKIILVADNFFFDEFFMPDKLPSYDFKEPIKESENSHHNQSTIELSDKDLIAPHL